MIPLLNIPLALTSVTFLLSSFQPANARVLDVSKTNFSEQINVYDGTFSDGGVYRLIYTRSPGTTDIHYGDAFITSVKVRGSMNTDIYVEVFKRRGTTLISITTASDSSCFVDNRENWEVSSSGITSRSRLEKQQFISGPVMIELNRNVANRHPVIETQNLMVEGNEEVWFYLGNRRRHDSAAMRSNIWLHETNFIISRVTNIDAYTQLVGGPKSALIANAIAFKQTNDESMITIRVPRTRGKQFVLHVPPTLDGYFKPEHIIWDKPKVRERSPAPLHERIFDIVIDVSNKLTPTYDMVILTDFVRGPWNYSQHTFLPIRFMDDMNVKVRNVERNITIFEIRPRDFITYVEVFHNRETAEEYVLIHTRSLFMPEGPDKIHCYIYVKEDSYKHGKYILMDLMEDFEKINMFKRIPTATPYDFPWDY
ncbi:hypothetical protein BBOV_III011350 [Babesia bovis T2Bo]|uniref:Uncharacterized protein n=1 Tax=Babesia bovis TaxID=5865 RepID=A7AQ53_BABBO|nr:hypothetical protein BBOV_III011350 [Babesia bovis T2Bo]EDO08687.1 hypothetical protein BBOV_III011350 [Babesia bovis T2Bo]|eukprot:XP_001612255.1 hypothetical protein [Babesia bovis T2Bo]